MIEQPISRYENMHMIQNYKFLLWTMISHPSSFSRYMTLILARKIFLDRIEIFIVDSQNRGEYLLNAFMGEIHHSSGTSEWRMPLDCMTLDLKRQQFVIPLEPQTFHWNLSGPRARWIIWASDWAVRVPVKHVGMRNAISSNAFGCINAYRNPLSDFSLFKRYGSLL